MIAQRERESEGDERRRRGVSGGGRATGERIDFSLNGKMSLMGGGGEGRGLG